MTPGASPATTFSVALLAEFVRSGVRDVVLSPGSRSQALALAAAEFERVGRIRLHVRIDERGAGFLALGLAVESSRPVLVVTTSGTAVANLHPAVLEAHHSGVPLILLTADRPAELRGIRSNQTTHQPGIFGVATRLAEDVAAPEAGTSDPVRAADAAALVRRARDAATGVQSAGPGPVQLNLAFREPLSSAFTLEEAGTDEGADAASVAPATDPLADVLADVLTDVLTDLASEPPLQIAPGLRTIVIAGHGAGEQAERFARSGGWPLLAEVSSGARFGPNLIVAYRELLQSADFGGQVERAIVFGHPTLSREIPTLIQRDGVETIVVAATGDEWYNPGHRVSRRARSVVADEASVADAATRPAREWLGRWVMTSRHVLVAEAEQDVTPIGERGITKAELAAMRAPVTRAMLADAIWRASWPHDRLVLGASRLIREADKRVLGKKIFVHANRGLAGIDGTISTAVGIALASQAGPEPRSSGTTRLLLGDLAFLHDVGSLLLAPGELRPRMQIVVGNDGGGTIFDGLEVAQSAHPTSIDRVLFTPQQVDLSSLAAAYGWSYSRAATRSDLERELTTPPAGPSILEVPLAR
ncbi:2-succinyl-5-enolpyruvyl-6-hydroxy-3-cyclohexene-1-carboxylic-acid synthase [Leifsonia kafniensis]